jgi:undecaprenyl diphosphate synthase
MRLASCIYLSFDMINKSIPQHIAIIMDGNGRWAQEKGLPRTAGHRQGVERVPEIVAAANQLGVKVLTLFAFSHENWSRPKHEINILMRYFEHFLEKQTANMLKNNIKFKVIGRTSPLPGFLLNKIKKVEEKTKDNAGLVFVIAANYGSRQEILDAVKIVVDQAIKGKITPDQITEETFSSYLYTAGLPDPDLLIRTSGEHRISNFLLWQLSYAELYFLNKYWPDFRKADLNLAIQDFQTRLRKFGAV